MTAPNRIPLNVLYGVPNYAAKLVRVIEDGRRIISAEGSPDSPDLAKNFLQLDAKGDGRVKLLGNANIVPFLSEQRFALRLLYLQRGIATRINVGPGAILSQIADPDMCPASLEFAAQLVKKTARPCFNAPEAVARTSRDQVARTLAGIAGLDVPKTICVEGPTPVRVRDAIAQAGLKYPVLLRSIGTHGGLTLSKVDTPQSIDSFPPSRALYATEFRDFRSPDRLYRKFRVVMVGNDIFLRHCIVGENWLLHANRRASDTEKSESAMFAAFEREWSKHLQPVFQEIGSRLRLDFFGVDCNIDDNGRVLLFEANAAMNILKNTSPSPNMWDEPIARITSALEQRLASPSAWYRPRA